MPPACLCVCVLQASWRFHVFYLALKLVDLIVEVAVKFLHFIIIIIIIIMIIQYVCRMKGGCKTAMRFRLFIQGNNFCDVPPLTMEVKTKLAELLPSEIIPIQLNQSMNCLP